MYNITIIHLPRNILESETTPSSTWNPVQVQSTPRNCAVSSGRANVIGIMLKCFIPCRERGGGGGGGGGWRRKGARETGGGRGM